MGIVLNNNNRPVLAKVVTADHYLSHSDNNCLMVVDGTDDIKLYLNNALPTGFTTRIIQRGTGRAVLIAAGVTMVSASGFTATSAPGTGLHVMSTQPNEFVVENIGQGSMGIDTNMGTILIYGNVTWAHDLVFDVSKCRYYILNQLYNTAATQITLDASDPAKDRIDVIYVDTNQNVGILKGVAAASPVKPIVDPATQLELTFIKVAAGATVPTGITNLDIYQEGVEWQGSSTITDASVDTNFESTTDPQKGLKCVQVPPHTERGNVIFKTDTQANIYDYSFFRMYVKIASPAPPPGGPVLNANVPNDKQLQIAFSNGDVIQNINTVVTLNATHGFNANLLDTWQLITVPVGQFNLTNPIVNSFYIWVNGTYAAPLYFDNIVLQGTGPVGGGSGGDGTLIKVKSANFTDATHYDNPLIVGKPLAIFFNNVPKYLDDDEWAATGFGINILIDGFDATANDYTFYIHTL